jgi:hypothetical protein
MNIHNGKKTDTVSDRELEFYLLGELPKRRLDAIRRLAESDGVLRGRIDALRAGGEALLAAHPPERMAPEIEKRLAERIEARGAGRANAPSGNGKSSPSLTTGGLIRSVRRARGLPRFAAPAAAFAVLLIALPIGMMSFKSADKSGDGPAAIEAAGGERVKGAVLTAPVIEVWRKEGDAARLLAPSASARKGDIVQLSYTVPASCYGALVSVDGRGVLTVHLAGDSGKAAPLTPGKPVLLNAAYKLDDAPLFEIFYLITAPDDFDVDDVTPLLKEADHPIDKRDEPSQIKITAFTLHKINL